jgi:hypothetical protein
MRTITYTGALTARSAISHVGDGGGRVHVFRREDVLTPQGQVIKVPMVSGAVIRGRMRRLGAGMVHEALGGTPLPFNAVTALAQGGVLAETRTTREVLTGDKQARLCQTVPFLGLMGVVAGGRMMKGRLIVSKAIPVATETLHLLPDEDRERLCAGGRRWPSVFELMNREGYTVGDDGGYCSSMVDDEGVERLGQGGPMRFVVETLIAGTVLWHRVVGEDLRPDEADCLEELMGVWSGSAQVGGGRARGMGDVDARYVRVVRDVLGRECDPEVGDWRAAMTGDLRVTREVLSWL